MKNIIILGSGRSGTSLAAGIFSKAGYHMGDNYLGKKVSNPKGFFEDSEVNTLNEDILNRILPSYPEKIRRLFFPTATYYRARWLCRIKPSKRIESTPDLDDRIQKLLQKNPFCYKDPRFSYTLPAWNPFLSSSGTVFLCVFRRPADTAMSIVKESASSKGLRHLKISPQIALDIWLCMYQHILMNFEKDPQKENWIFVHYEQLFDAEKLNQIRELTGAALDYSFPDKSISKTQDSKLLLPKSVQHAYQTCCSHASYTNQK